MRPLLASGDRTSVNTRDGSKVELLHLAGDGGPVVLLLHANGFHVKSYGPLVSSTVDSPNDAVPAGISLESPMCALKAKCISQSCYQCWGLEFRGQGSISLPQGNLVDLYLQDLLSVIHTLHLKGAACRHPCISSSSISPQTMPQHFSTSEMTVQPCVPTRCTCFFAVSWLRVVACALCGMWLASHASLIKFSYCFRT